VEWGRNCIIFCVYLEDIHLHQGNTIYTWPSDTVANSFHFSVAFSGGIAANPITKSCIHFLLKHQVADILISENKIIIKNDNSC